MSGEGPQQPTPSPRAGSPAHARTITWGPLFARMLTVLIVFGVASFIAMIVLPGIWADPTSSQSSAEQNVSLAFFTILGCFVGLVTGKLT